MFIRLRLGLVAAITATMVAPCAPAAAAAPPSAQILGARSSSAIPNSYLVRLKEQSSSAVPDAARVLAVAHHGALGPIWDRSPQGFAVTMNETDALRLAAEPGVAYVQQNHRWSVQGSQVSPPWGLDRIDQRSLPLDHFYDYDESSGNGVHVYVVDTGIRRTHADFEGRVVDGGNFLPDGRPNAEDCNGHGTEVAGIIAGHTYGVAKKAELIAVRAFDCNGSGDSGTVVTAIRTIRNRVVANRPHWPAVINLSIGPTCLGPCDDPLLQEAINDAVSAGITVVAAAGNGNQDACLNAVGSTLTAITVGATNEGDTRWAQSILQASNYGSCVDIWAPGANIPTDRHMNDIDTTTVSGTSAAAAEVTGAVALLLGTPQFAEASPGQIMSQLANTATRGVVTSLPTGSNNLLLFTQTVKVSDGPAIALTHNADGRLALFGATSDGLLFWRNQAAVNASGWDTWTHSSTQGWRSVAAGLAGNNRIGLAALTITGQVFRRRQAGANAAAWTTALQLDGRLAAVAVTRHQDGRLAMLATDSQGAAMVRSESAVGSDVWGPWLAFPTAGVHLSTVTAALNGNGRIEAVFLDDAGGAWHTVQASADSDSWRPLSAIADGLQLSEVALARNADRTLLLAATDGHGGVWRRTEKAPDSATWFSWSQLPDHILLTHIAADSQADGRIQLVGVTDTGSVFQAAQTAANAATYTGWTRIDGQLRP